MKKKQAIVTGASSGFGLMTVLELAQSDYHVIATMRNLEKSKLLENELTKLKLTQNVDIIKLDVTSTEDVNEFKHKLEDYNNIQVLVNNAGFAQGGFTEDVSIEKYRKQFETNVLGVIAVSQAVIPRMRKQRSGRIINLSSVSGLIGFPSLSAYVASKHALEGFSESLRLELKPFGIDVILIEPGSYATNIWNSSISEVKSLKNNSTYDVFMEKIQTRLKNEEKNLGNPIEVAKLITFAAKTAKPKLRYAVGKGVKLNHLVKRMLPWRMWEKIVLKLLYK
ncbi:SDR family oxidoreductase [Chengkuizengella sediminis]|uniref:SDR family oxidoreductase n=1 Tax=Chengkuizengella sediminis TaxID=1885917 RepID=UPI001389C9A2|nr:SDR family oxidoreductase [Chengkuizengella sediminis]NDI35411.1 SDR family oxidoreductase [Chengkuizengella sediminis]